MWLPVSKTAPIGRSRLAAAFTNSPNRASTVARRWLRPGTSSTFNKTLVSTMTIGGMEAYRCGP